MVVLGESKKPSLRVDVVTLFPAMFEGPFRESILGRASAKGLVDVRIHDLRAWSCDRRHRKVDDRPYGGGPGMVIQPEPVYRAVRELKKNRVMNTNPFVVYMSPQGVVFTQELAKTLVKKKHLIVLCGHYEGVDERAMSCVDMEVSIGDYILTGGEIPAMVVMDAVLRLVPGVVGDSESIVNESFSNRLLDFPHYTRPRIWRGKKVPKVLLSGDHEAIAKWRKEQSLFRTAQRRPDLIKMK